MFRKRLVATVAVAPLLLFASGAFAETTISDTRKVSVSTATINNGAADDLVIDEDGEVTVTTGGTAGAVVGAVTVNSNNTFTNDGGEISAEGVDHLAGIRVVNGVTTTIVNDGQIVIDEDYDTENDDKDKDDDGKFAIGTDRYGILVEGAMTGDLINDTSGSITIEGNDSYGIRVMGPLTGDLLNRGTISVTGDNARGIQVEAPITGNFETTGSISVQGENAIGVALDSNIDGAVHIQGSVAATGYRYTSRPSEQEDRDNLDADDLLQGGPAVRITGNVTGGILLDVAPESETDFDNDGILDSVDDDDDGDGILDDDDKDLDNDGIIDDDYDNDGVKNSSDKDDDNDGILDDDDDDDNGDGIPDNDLDNDGRTNEGSAAISVVGAAPALQIGSTTQDVTIGAVGVGDEAYGLIIRGSVSASGVYDNVSATGVKIGGSALYDTIITGGAVIDGSITATGYNADVQGLHLATGANVDALIISGSISSGAAVTSSKLADEDEFDITAIRIDAGASVTSLNNSGTISAYVYGEGSNATAVKDTAGQLTSITNSGWITASVIADDDDDDTDDSDDDADNETVTGQAVALDLRNAVSGVSILQFAVAGDRDNDGVPDSVDGDDDNDGILDADDDDLDNDGIKNDDDDDDDLDEDGDGVVDSQEPAILGNILLGAGDDTLDIRNGSVVGDISFGDGADTLIIGTVDYIATVEGDLTDSDGQLTIDVRQGELTVTNAATIDATAINISSSSTVIFTADPSADSNTKFTVATANIGDGATLGLQLKSLIDEPERYVVIKTDTPGGLTVGTLDQSLTGNAPYLVVAQASADTAAGEVYIDVRRRTATEMELNQSEAAALDAVYDALSLDDDILASFLNAEDRKEFIGLYDQLLPDQGEGLFSSLDSITRTISRLTAARPDLRQRYGPDSFWIQEVNVQVMRDAGVTAGSETKAFGFVGGYESMGPDGGALGATLAFVSAEEKDDVAKIGEETSTSLLEAGIYWRRSIGKFTINARGAVGYGWFNGDRVFIDSSDETPVIVEANSEWTGFTGVASLGGSYEATAGRFYARPGVSLDYLYLSEDGRTETSKNEAIPLIIEGRTSSRLSATAEIAIGATFGRDLWWRPELRLGYRQHLAGEIGETVFAFKNGSYGNVTLLPTEPGDGSMIVGLSLKAGTAMSYVAVEGEYEVMDDEDRYNLQLAGRMMF